MEVKFTDMVKQIPVRIAELIVKLISVKGFILALSTWMALSTEMFGHWELVAVYLVVIFGREALKIVEKFH